MVSCNTKEILEWLASEYIPEGTHVLLHVDCRKLWKDVMLTLIKNRSIPVKISILKKCAVNWQLILTQHLITKN
jgi:hypothetical protein